MPSPSTFLTSALGGISLFDFDNFDPGFYEKSYPSSSWAYFVPFHLAWECAVWIELNRTEILAPKYIAGLDLLSMWKSTKSYGHNFMPEIEAAYLGEISSSVFKRAFFVSKGDNEIRHLVRKDNLWQPDL